MKNFTLLFLFCCSFFSIQGQNVTDGVLLNPAYVQPEPSFFGTTDISYFECDANIVLDGSSSMGEDSYKLILAEFDLATWTTQTVLYDQWQCTSCTVPNAISITSLFPNGSPNCDRTYILTLATGPVYDAKFFFFSVDCGDDPILKSFSAKVNSNLLDLSIPSLTSDLCHSAYEDPVTKVIHTAAYTDGIGTGKFDPLQIDFATDGTKLSDYSIPDGANDFIYYNNPAIVDCGSSAYATISTGRRDNDFLINIDDPISGLNLYNNVFGENNGFTEVGNSIIQDPNGGMVAVGFIKGPSTENVFVVSLDSCFDVRYTREYELPQDARANSVTIVDNLYGDGSTSFLNFYYAITGTTATNDVFVLVIDPFTGKRIGNDYLEYDIDNNSDDTGESIIMDSNGDLVVTGTTTGPSPSGTLNQQLYVLKIDKGNFEQNSEWGDIIAAVKIDIQNSKDESSHSIAETDGGDYVLTGYAKASFGGANPPPLVSQDAHITKINSDLNNLIFCNSYSEGARLTVGERIDLGSNGRLILSGYCSEFYELNSGALVFDSDVYVVATDSLGQLDNCICYEKELAVLLDAMPSFTRPALLQVDWTEPEFPVLVQYNSYDLPVSYCDQYCPPSTGGSTCAATGCSASSVLNISTGIDAFGNLLATNSASSIDPFWQVINFPPLRDPTPPGINLPEMYPVNLFQTNWNDISGVPISQPLNIVPMAGFNADNLDVNQPWRIRREFCVCDTSNVNIDGIMRADDFGSMRLYSGINPTTPLVNIIGQTNVGAGAFNNDRAFSWTGTLNPGTYHLEFEMVNTNGTAMGFNVSALITDLGNNSTLLNSAPNCCGNGVITVQKLIDRDCSGDRSPGDVDGVNWNIQLTNTTTGQMYNRTTDGFGEAIFRQIPFGTYTVTEIFSAPWMSADGSGGTKTVTLDATNPVEVVSFLNKNPELCTCIDEQINDIFPTPFPQNEDCCFELIIDNDYGLYYDAVEVVSNGFTISLLNNTAGWPISTTANSIKASTVIPQAINQSVVEFCTNDLAGNGTITINWYYQGMVVCTSEKQVFCEDPCDIRSTIAPVQMGDQCCYTLDLDNQNSNAHKIDIIINTPSVFFDIASVSTAFNLFNTGPQVITLDNGGSAIPNGITANYFNFCLGNTGSTVTLQNFTIKYYDAAGNEITDCEQEFEEECLLPCTDDDCVDVIDISVECDSLDPTKFKFTYQVINQSTSYVFDVLNWNVLTPGAILGSTSTPIVAPIGPGATSTNQCVDIFSAGPFPQQVDIVFDATGYILGNPDSLMCCHDLKDTLTITLPFCCDPCDTTWVTAESIPAVGGDCCYKMDINNTCPDLLSKVKVTSLTTGVNLGSHWNPNFPSTWSFTPLTGTEVIWEPIGSNFAPVGNYNDLIHFCLDNTVGATNPIVKVEYVTTNANGVDSVLCEEIFELECEVDITCIDVTQQNVYCDANGDYYLDFCVQNISVPAFNADELRISKLSSTPPWLNLSQTIFNGSPNFPLASGAPPVCFTVQVNGIGANVPMAGDMMDLAFSLKSGIPADSCCLESDTISVLLPPCPVDTNIVGCCDSLIIYGDVDENMPWRIKVYNGYSYIASSRTSSAGVYGVFSKFDWNGNLIWEKQLDVQSRFFDFVQTDNNEFLVVGRTEPVGPTNNAMDNKSILTKIDDNGVDLFVNIYDNDGRETFYRIVKHSNPKDPAFKYYIDALDNSNRTSPSPEDRFHLISVNELGNINLRKEYTYIGSNNLTANDDQIVGITTLSNGNLLVVGDYDPNFSGILIELDGLTGASVNEFESTNRMRFSDAVQLPSGDIVVVGAYNPASAAYQGGIFLFDSSYNYLHSLRYTSNQIGLIREVEYNATTDELFASGQAINDIPFILKFQVDTVADVINELDSKYFIDGETAFRNPAIFTNSSLSRLHYADARRDHPDAYGDFDIIFGSFDLNLSDSCLIDTVLTVVETPFGTTQVTVTEVDYTLPQPTSAMLIDPNYMYEYICLDSISMDTCCTDINDFIFRSQQTMFNVISTTPFVGEVANPLLNDCNTVNIDWGDGQVDVAVPFANLPIQHTYASTGSYTVQVAVYEYDATGMLCLEDFVNGVLDFTSSTQNLLLENKISFFPNPFAQDFQIRIENTKHDGFELSVYSVNGQMILQESIQPGVHAKTLDLNTQAGGMYLIQLTDKNGNRAMSRMIKMNQ